MTGSGIDPAAAQELASWADRSGGRVALIRRPGSGRAPSRERRWYTVDSRPGQESVRSGTYVEDRELLDVVAARGEGELVEDPVYLVCTHGKHDTCCAVRGRPVAAALAADFPERTWECSHVGGDRFAANLVVLPHGFYYGHVPPDAAVELARQHDKGLVDPRWLRGRSSLPPAVQAAQHHARLRTGDCSVSAFGPRDVEYAGAGEWRVVLSTEGTKLEVILRERMVASGRRLTCSASAPGSYRTFDLLGLAEV